MLTILLLCPQNFQTFLQPCAYEFFVDIEIGRNWWQFLNMIYYLVPMGSNTTCFYEIDFHFEITVVLRIRLVDVETQSLSAIFYIDQRS